jgi:hypothetical protein
MSEGELGELTQRKCKREESKKTEMANVYDLCP